MPNKKSNRSCFIKSLISEINKNKVIYTNALNFIKTKNLTPFSFGKKSINVTEDDLPSSTILGSTYLIKKNNIIEVYSWCDPSYSLYLQINMKRPAWIGTLDIINTESGDPDNIQYLLNDCDRFSDPDNLQYMIVHFINNGFALYVNK